MLALYKLAASQCQIFIMLIEFHKKLVDRYYGHIPIEKMNPLYQQYYRLIHEKNAKGIFAAKRKFENKVRRKQKYINPVINLLTESRFTGTIYKKVRNKG